MNEVQLMLKLKDSIFVSQFQVNNMVCINSHRVKHLDNKIKSLAMYKRLVK